MIITITGGRGFVGNFLTSYLRLLGHKVYRPTRDNLIELRQVSRLSAAVIHCAAAAGPWHTTSDIIRDNIEFTRLLVDHCNPKKLVFISSVSVYGDIRTESVRENTEISNPSIYGMSKKICEDLITKSKIPAISLRCPGIVGPRCTGRNWTTILAHKLYKCQPVEIYNALAPFNSVVHVADIGKFISQQLGQITDGHAIMNLAADVSISIGAVVDNMKKTLNSKSEITIVPEKKRWHLFDTSIARTLGWWPMTVQETITRFAQEVYDEQQA